MAKQSAKNNQKGRGARGANPPPNPVSKKKNTRPVTGGKAIQTAKFPKQNAPFKGKMNKRGSSKGNRGTDGKGSA